MDGTQLSAERQILNLFTRGNFCIVHRNGRSYDWEEVPAVSFMYPRQWADWAGGRPTVVVGI
jgi:hypothetical protein